MPRALESVQQSFWGMYPLTARTASLPPPTIITRTPQDETLYPNDSNCSRFSQLFKAFGQRTADRCKFRRATAHLIENIAILKFLQGNNTPEMEHLSSLISKWMPGESKVAVDSHPRLSGIMDTINSTLAHGPETRLPAPFYDAKARAIIDKIGVEEWFSGFKESNEYRQLGCGALAGDIVARMVGSVERKGNDGLLETGGDDGHLGKGRGGEKALRLGLSGCHDTTLAALLSSLGAFDGERWPPYTSHIAFELFKASEKQSETTGRTRLDTPVTASDSHKQNQNRFLTIFGKAGRPKPATEGLSRKRTEDLTSEEREKLGGHYVRVRYNDRPVVIPGCRLPGKHLEGNESFCTLVSRFFEQRLRVLFTDSRQEAFKAIVAKFTPKNWKDACMSNLDRPKFPQETERSGY